MFTNPIMSGVEEKKLRVERFESMRQVSESLWDSVCASKGLFGTHRFIRTAEEAEVENARFWYLLFYDDQTPVAAAALSSFNVSLDLFLGRGVQKVVKLGRAIWPGFFKINVLFCGLPVSIGRNTLAVAAQSCEQRVIDGLVKEMEAIAAENGIAYFCAKEFREDESHLTERLQHWGFFRAHSIPAVSMPIRWPDFRSYLNDMRWPYRRQVKCGLKKLGVTEPFARKRLDGRQLDPSPWMTAGGASACSAERFCELYLQVMQRVTSKLEILNEAFFRRLYQNLENELEIVTVAEGETVLAAALLSVHAGTMTFLLVGMDYARRNDYDVYFNLIYGIVAHAIRRGCVRLELGQTSYWPKLRLGGRCTPMHFYLRASGKVTHFLLSKLRFLLFPEVRLREPHVFKSDSPGSSP